MQTVITSAKLIDPIDSGGWVLIGVGHGMGYITCKQY